MIRSFESGRGIDNFKFYARSFEKTMIFSCGGSILSIWLQFQQGWTANAMPSKGHRDGDQTLGKLWWSTGRGFSNPTYGAFHSHGGSWGYPQIIHFNGNFPYKPSILRYLQFRKPYIFRAKMPPRHASPFPASCAAFWEGDLIQTDYADPGGVTIRVMCVCSCVFTYDIFLKIIHIHKAPRFTMRIGITSHRSIVSKLGTAIATGGILSLYLVFYRPTDGNHAKYSGRLKPSLACPRASKHGRSSVRLLEIIWFSGSFHLGAAAPLNLGWFHNSNHPESHILNFEWPMRLRN